MAYASYISPKVICFIVFVLVGSVSCAISQNPKCPFDFMFHTGDGVFDIGNAILSRPFGQDLPANKKPYGMSMSPGTPNGRWSDGLLDIDIGATAMGLPQLAPSLAKNASHYSDGVVFAVARSPVLDRNFFTARGVRIPPFAAPLSIQMSWFRKYLDSICFTPKDCADKVSNSIFIFGDVEANDIGLALNQGKSIKEVRTYIPYVTRAQIDAAREVIQMGATKVIICGNVPIGCYPYLLTKLSSSDYRDYEDGCLKKVNEVIQAKNKHMENAVEKLKREFPDITIYFGDFYSAFMTLLKDTYSGPNYRWALSACCGTGSYYNYNSKKFCGTPGVPVCRDPNKYIHWDGIHLTQHASNILSLILQKGALGVLNCTTTPSLKSSI